MSPLTANEVEKDLADLWKAPSGDKTGDLGLQRVYTTNLVTYALNYEAGFRAERILNDLAEHHPGRYILVRPSLEGEEPSLKHFISGHCFIGSDKEKKVCCDLIKLVAGEGVIENLYGFTFALLLPDLPVEFWWPGDLSISNPFFQRMAEESDRVWVDSSKFSDPVGSLALLAATWKTRHPDTLLEDLNWVRIHRWRALIAELFDGEWAIYLKEIQKVTIEYGDGTSPTRGFTLACWLAHQLGWGYQGPRVTLFPNELNFTSPHGPVKVILKPVPVRDLKRDLILAVRLETSGKRSGRFTVARSEDPSQVLSQSEIDGQKSFSRTVSFQHLHSNELLGEGLKHLQEDQIWTGTLRMAGTILEDPNSSR